MIFNNFQIKIDENEQNDHFHYLIKDFLQNLAKHPLFIN